MTRYDIYGRAHKALRALMADTLVAVGRADLADDCEAREAIARVEELLAACEGHARLENDFVHGALDARRPDASAVFAAEHAKQEAHIESLRDLAARRSPGLHRALAVFIAHNLLHMEDEETAGNAQLQALFTDEEIHAIERRLVGSKPPADSMATLRWMLPSLSHPERVALLAGMRSAPPAVLEGALALARTHLSPRDFERLSRAENVPGPFSAEPA